MSQNRFAAEVNEILRGTLEGVETELLVVNPSRATIPRLVTEVQSLEAPPEVQLLATTTPLKAVMGDFLVASEVANLVATGVLSIRVLEDGSGSSVLVSDESVTALVYGDEQVAGLVTDDDAFVGDVRSRYDRQWEASEEFSLRTPPLSRVRETLAAEVGTETAADFDAVLESLDAARGDGDGLDEVTVSLLAAARNGELLYDISKWGEDVGLASKATFSRTKTELEKAGVVATEKVPIEVGRPRLRLRLGDDRLRSADRDEFGALAELVLGG